MIQINCDLCGKVEDNLIRTLIENVELEVCSGCSKFGKVIAPVKRFSPKEQHKMMQRAENAKALKEEKTEILVENYADLIKRKRESLGLSQKDFALKINEKESTIHNIETCHFEPPVALAKKLEKVLGIKLIEVYDEKPLAMKKRKNDGGFTLGDFINIKK